MTSDILQPEPFRDLAATGTPPPRPASLGPSAPGALLRALLAGAVALLVLLLPGQLAASRDDGRMAYLEGMCAIGYGPLLAERSQRDRVSALEIRRRVTC